MTTLRSTSTRPEVINSSHCRRLPWPAAASTFWQPFAFRRGGAGLRLAAGRSVRRTTSACGGERGDLRHGEGEKGELDEASGRACEITH